MKKNIFVSFILSAILMVGVFAFAAPARAEASSLWGVAQEQLGSQASASSIMSLAKSLAIKFNIAVPEWEIAGLRDAKALSKAFFQSIFGERARAQSSGDPIMAPITAIDQNGNAVLPSSNLTTADSITFTYGATDDLLANDSVGLLDIGCNGLTPSFFPPIFCGVTNYYGPYPTQATASSASYFLGDATPGQCYTFEAYAHDTLMSQGTAQFNFCVAPPAPIITDQQLSTVGSGPISPPPLTPVTPISINGNTYDYGTVNNPNITVSGTFVNLATANTYNITIEHNNSNPNVVYQDLGFNGVSSRAFTSGVITLAIGPNIITERLQCQTSPSPACGSFVVEKLINYQPAVAPPVVTIMTIVPTQTIETAITIEGVVTAPPGQFLSGDFCPSQVPAGMYPHACTRLDSRLNPISSYPFSVYFPLAVGANTLTITFTESSGNVITESRVIERIAADTTSPTIREQAFRAGGVGLPYVEQICSLRNCPPVWEYGTIDGASLVVSGLAIDNNALESVEIKLIKPDASIQTLFLAPNPFDCRNIEGCPLDVTEYPFSALLPGALPIGDYSIEEIIKDTAGNTLTFTKRFTVGAPAPVITLEYDPVSGSIINQTTPITATSLETDLNTATAELFSDPMVSVAQYFPNGTAAFLGSALASQVSFAFVENRVQQCFTKTCQIGSIAQVDSPTTGLFQSDDLLTGPIPYNDPNAGGLNLTVGTRVLADVLLSADGLQPEATNIQVILPTTPTLTLQIGGARPAEYTSAVNVCIDPIDGFTASADGIQQFGFFNNVCVNWNGVDTSATASSVLPTLNAPFSNNLNFGPQLLEENVDYSAQRVILEHEWRTIFTPISRWAFGGLTVCNSFGGARCDVFAIPELPKDPQLPKEPAILPAAVILAQIAPCDPIRDPLCGGGETKGQTFTANYTIVDTIAPTLTASALSPVFVNHTTPIVGQTADNNLAKGTVLLTLNSTFNGTPTGLDNLEISVDASGNFSFLPPVFTATGIYGFTFTAYDASGNMTSATVSITVIPEDTDGDGVLDPDDQCPTVPGTVFRGCPFKKDIKVSEHIVNQLKDPSICGLKSDGKVKTECKVPGANVLVREYARDNADFLAAYGTNINKKQADTIFGADIGLVGTCTTDANGTCSIGVPTPTKYLAIAKLTYRGVIGYKVAKEYFQSKTHDEGDEDEEEHDDDDDHDSPQSSFLTSISKMLRFEITVDKNGVTRINPASKIKREGSLLEVVYPEYTVWTDGTELYPFIMTSDSDWTTDVCLQVPVGYAIAAVYDEEGNILPTNQCQQTFISGETKVVLFSVTDVGSPEPEFTFSLNTAHKEPTTGIVKETKEVVSIGGVRHETKAVQDAQLAVKIAPIVAKIEAEKKVVALALAAKQVLAQAEQAAQGQGVSAIAQTFQLTLAPGTQSADVLRLQQYLNNRGFTLASSGAGSPGNETNVFGPRTREALRRFQEANRGAILAPLGLLNGTGIFGPSTRAFINANQ